MSLSTKSKLQWPGRRAKSSLTSFTIGGHQPAGSDKAARRAREASPDSQLLASARKCQIEFEQMHVLNGMPLTDAGVLKLRKRIEELMPRLYALLETGPNDKKSVMRVIQHAENTLLKFPDVRLENLRPNFGGGGSGGGAGARVEMLPPAGRGVGFATDSRRAVPGALVHMPPAVGVARADMDAPSHLRDAIQNTRPTEQQVFFAVQELLGGGGSRGGGSGGKWRRWYEPPSAMSPNELEASTEAAHGYYHGGHVQFGHSIPSYLGSMGGVGGGSRGPPSMTLPPASGPGV